MSKKKLNISLDSSSDNQDEINDSTCLKKLKKHKKTSSKKRINNINITTQKSYIYLIILFLILILFFLILIIFLRYRHKPISNISLISKTPEEEYKDSKE